MPSKSGWAVRKFSAAAMAFGAIGHGELARHDVDARETPCCRASSNPASRSNVDLLPGACISMATLPLPFNSAASLRAAICPAWKLLVAMKVMIVSGIHAGIEYSHGNVGRRRAIERSVQRGAVLRRDRQAIHLPRDHGIHDLHLARVVGLRGRSVPNHIHIELLPAAMAPACTETQNRCEVALGTTAMVLRWVPRQAVRPSESSRNAAQAIHVPKGVVRIVELVDVICLSRLLRSLPGTSRAPSPVNQHVRSRNKSRVRRAQIDGQLADFFHAAPAAQRNFGDELGVQFRILDQSAVFISVAKGPGLMAFTVIPPDASSSASARVRPSSALLLAE